MLAPQDAVDTSYGSLPESPALGARLDLELVTENLQNFGEIPLTTHQLD